MLGSSSLEKMLSVSEGEYWRRFATSSRRDGPAAWCSGCGGRELDPGVLLCMAEWMRASIEGCLDFLSGG